MADPISLCMEANVSANLPYRKNESGKIVANGSSLESPGRGYCSGRLVSRAGKICCVLKVKRWNA